MPFSSLPPDFVTAVMMALEAWTLEEWENMMALNLRSVFLLSQAAARHMMPRGRGVIVNISSGAGETGLPWVAPYGAAKAGVNNLTRALAAGLGPHGIRVNAIAVGAVKSEGFVRAMARAGRDPDEVGRHNALGRAGLPEEIAYPILFLCSRASAFLTGETRYTDAAAGTIALFWKQLERQPAGDGVKE